MMQADPSAPPSPAAIERAALRALAIRLVEAERAHRGHALDLARMLQVLPLEREGGTRLMRLAEALPRTPDAPTRIALLADKLDPVDWSAAAGEHAGALGAAVRAAMPAARAMLPDARDAAAGTASSPLARALVMPAARAVLERIGAQFVHANDIRAALDRAARETALHSFDMLGEGARGWPDADRNQRRYLDAIAAVGAVDRDRPCHARQGVSIKLSAIHPRFELPRFARERGALLERLRALCGAAAEAGIPLNIDAEEHDRLSMTLELFDALARDASLAGWPGLGIVAQAYQRSAASTVATLVPIARGRVAAGGAPIAVRLVKGAYWDAEVKRAQELGLDDYPVFVRKADTDASYARCARALLDATDALRPQFATHNAVTVACVLREAVVRGVAPDAFELQRLHGMGAALHAALGVLATRRALPVAARAGASSSAPWAAADADADAKPGLPQCRVYAPVGEQRDLLAYLIRRILENGASTSFVRRFADPDLSAAELVDAELDAFVAPEETAP